MSTAATTSRARAEYWDHNIRPVPVAFPDYPTPSPMEEYLFDLRGFVVLRGALSGDEVRACNEVVDQIPPLCHVAAGGDGSSGRTTRIAGVAATSRSTRPVPRSSA